MRTRSGLETLLNEKYGKNKIINEPFTHEEMPIESEQRHLQAEKSADLDDFIEMVGKIVTKVMKKDNVYFNPDEGARIIADPNEKNDNPSIQYEVISCVPKNELKPRVRRLIAEYKDEDGNISNRHGQVWGQKFKAFVQFNIFGCDYMQCSRVMKVFEELMFTYTAYFKKNGVSELLFQSRLTDRNFDEYRQKGSVRSLQYYIEFERNYVSYDSELEHLAIYGAR